MDECSLISQLWVELNPHCSVQGCTIDADGNVQIFVWYGYTDSATGQKTTHPIELTLGNPPKTVIRGLRQAARMKNLTHKRLLADGSQVVGEAAGNSSQTGIVERDK